MQDLGRLLNTMDYFRNTIAGLGETVEYHGLILDSDSIHNKILLANILTGNIVT